MNLNKSSINIESNLHQECHDSILAAKAEKADYVMTASMTCHVQVQMISVFGETDCAKKIEDGNLTT